MTLLDFLVLGVYLVGVAALGLRLGGRQSSANDYFLASGRLPWWAVSLSVVATETSSLTVISIPAVAYGGTMTFFQLTIGYVLGRTLVAIYLLPRFMTGSLKTAYGFLGDRFGPGARSAASVTFMATRLLADGVRLFAAAIPVRVILLSAGWDVGYPLIIGVISAVTVVYTVFGGLRAVVWMDVVQLFLYLGGAVATLFLLLADAPDGWARTVTDAGKFDWFEVGSGVAAVLTGPYTLVTAAIGGAVFSVASHGTDQLIVQRLLACRSLADSRRALVASGVLVMAQFALFLLIGSLLWIHYDGASLAELGLSRGDEIYPRYIIEGLPPGISGLFLAGIVAAAMSTLSSSLSALASATVFDFVRKDEGAASELRISRWTTLAWGVVFVVFANLFRDQRNPVVELGLSIASFTYGGLLGTFLLGLWNRRASGTDAIAALVTSVAVMVAVIFGTWYSADAGWVFHFRPDPETIAAMGLRPLAWPWYTAVGASVTLAVGSLLALRHR